MNHKSDDDSSEYTNDMEENDDLDAMSCFSTSSIKRKRSSSSNKNKNNHASAKRIRFNDSRVSINVDEAELDIPQVVNCMKELNESNKHLLKQQKQVILAQERIEKTLKFLLKNQRKIAKAMNQKNVCSYG